MISISKQSCSFNRCPLSDHARPDLFPSSAVSQKFRAVQLKNHSKSITKTRRYENTKQKPESQVGASMQRLPFRVFPGPDLAHRLSRRLIRARSARAGNLSCFRDNSFFASLTINPISNRIGGKVLYSILAIQHATWTLQRL